MYKIINNFYIETGYDFNLAKSTVTTIVEVDAFGRCVFGECVFMGDWNDCIEYANTH